MLSAKTLAYLFGIVLLVTLGAGGYLWFLYTELQNENATLLARLDTTESTLVTTNTEMDLLRTELQATQDELRESEEVNDELENDLERERDINENFSDQIKEITGTVGDLDKLAKTDRELLQKYSKVFFLNEHYMPEKLSEIEKKYLSTTNDDPKFVHAKVEPFLEDMLDDAKDDDIQIFIASAFRSFDTQASLKGQYQVTYGSGANTFSADQGYSEHQLGTTLDFTTEGLNGSLTGFENTSAYAWLLKNAHRYGFTLSYPQNNAYYVFEPWHWRFVGIDLARDLHEENNHFYDLEQREIDKYLISIFD